MKICDVVTNPIWYDPRVKKQIASYADMKDIELVCVGLRNNRYNKEEIDKLPCPANIVEVDKKYYRTSRTIFTKMARELLIIGRLRDAIIQTKADIIHANDLDALVPAYLASKKLKCKLVYDTHEIFLENNNMLENKLKRSFWGRWEKKIIHRVDQVVCVSNAAAEYLRKKYDIPAPMVVTNCVNTVDNAIIQTAKTDKFEILNHGQFYEGRGYDLMVQASPYLKDYPDIFLVLRGLGRMEAELREQINANDAKNVRMDPPVRVEELIPMAAKSNVGVAITVPYCLNFELSVSNKIFEYAAAGLPVIMSDIPEHRYLNEKYRFGIVLEENSPRCISEAAKKLHDDINLYEECRSNAIKMSQELNWETEFGKLISFERKLVKK